LDTVLCKNVSVPRVNNTTNWLVCLLLFVVLWIQSSCLIPCWLYL